MELDQAIDELDRYVSTQRIRGTLSHPADPAKARRVRSTRRRDDAPDLPKLPVSRRTVGKVYTGADGSLQLAHVPCSPSCANWLLYGVQPDQAHRGLVPGRCSGKVHQRRTLGFTGRRVLISRKWSGKTLADHRADNAAWVRTVLSGALADAEQPAADPTPAGRYSYQLARSNDPDVPDLDVRIMRAIAVRERWQAQLDQALRPPEPVSATQDPLPIQGGVTNTIGDPVGHE